MYLCDFNISMGTAVLEATFYIISFTFYWVGAPYGLSDSFH